MMLKQFVRLFAKSESVKILDDLTCNTLFEGTMREALKTYKYRTVKQISQHNDRLLIYVSQMDVPESKERFEAEFLKEYDRMLKEL